MPLKAGRYHLNLVLPLPREIEGTLPPPLLCCLFLGSPFVIPVFITFFFFLNHIIIDKKQNKVSLDMVHYQSCETHECSQ